MRLSELMATMSLAGDAGMGLPDEQALRCAVLAVGLGEEVGASDGERADAYWLSLLRYAGCTADSDLASSVMGDEIAFHGAMDGIEWGEPREMMALVARTIGREKPLPGRVLAVLRGFARMSTLMDSSRAHCEVGDRLAARF